MHFRRNGKKFHAQLQVQSLKSNHPSIQVMMASVATSGSGGGGKQSGVSHQISPKKRVTISISKQGLFQSDISDHDTIQEALGILISEAQR